jgi:P27 family predicted phage terminase small subunit
VRGAKPKPTHLKLLAGNPGKRPLNRNEPKPQGDLHDAPDWLTDEQKAGWTYAIANAPAGLMKRLDRSALTAFVVAEDLHRQATVAVGKFGLITKSPSKGEPMQNPYLPIINRQAQIMLKAAAELGFTPSSRSRVEIVGGETEDPAEAFFARTH